MSAKRICTTEKTHRLCQSRRSCNREGATRQPKSKTVLTERGGWSHPPSALGDEDHQEINELHQAVCLITQELRCGSSSECMDVLENWSEVQGQLSLFQIAELEGMTLENFVETYRKAYRNFKQYIASHFAQAFDSWLRQVLEEVKCLKHFRPG